MKNKTNRQYIETFFQKFHTSLILVLCLSSHVLSMPDKTNKTEKDETTPIKVVGSNLKAEKSLRRKYPMLPVASALTQDSADRRNLNIALPDDELALLDDDDSRTITYNYLNYSK